MFDVCLAGTGGTIPLKNRWLTTAYFRYGGSSFLIDCGEGTQIALKEAGCALCPIRVLLITHLHADHISGLPGLLLSMGNEGKTDKLTIIGPKNIGYAVRGLCTVAPHLPFELEVIELSASEQVFSLYGLEITAFLVKHTVPCYGYSAVLKRPGRFDPERAKAAGIPIRAWGLLQKQSTVEFDGALYTQDMVLGPERRGIKFVYTTDTRPCDSIVAHAADADLFICEGMYGEADKLPKALETRHMMFSEADELCVKAGGVRRLWLTHFSPSVPYPEADADAAPHAVIPHDGAKIELMFDPD